MTKLKKRATALVAPLVGAWIEMSLINDRAFFPKSLLSWERGLKLCIMFAKSLKLWSLLSWERGLKYGKTVDKLFLYGRSSRGSVD